MNSIHSIKSNFIKTVKTIIYCKSTNWCNLRNFSVGTPRNMKLVQFVYKNDPKVIRAGYLCGDNIVDINKADSSISSILIDILRNNDIDKVKCMKPTNEALVPLANVLLAAPIHGNDKVLCIGLNYRDHCEEQNIKAPEVPMMFSKFSSTIIGPKDAVKLRTGVTNYKDLIKELRGNVIVATIITGPAAGQLAHIQRVSMTPMDLPISFQKKVDWEVELAVVIGKRTCNVKAADAFNYVLGYTVAQDISARDWQKTRNGGQFLLGKSMDTFCPIGPSITTADEIGDPQNLDIKCCINGVLKQSSNTNQLVHKIPDVIERLSSVMTLLPGDILLTGTPGGVGMYRSPPEYLKPGDVIHSEIQNIGVLETKVENF